MAYDVLVIGAGHNGLTTACYLAKSGRRVLVLERRHLVGGAVCTQDDLRVNLAGSWNHVVSRGNAGRCCFVTTRTGGASWGWSRSCPNGSPWKFTLSC
ncbi:MAG: FAD-dependent oxidoreductase [Verrucomicrobiota bacterium]